MTIALGQHLGRRLAALSIGQVISSGILYYVLIVASPAIAADTGWSLATVTLAFSIGLIASALAGFPVGLCRARHPVPAASSDTSLVEQH